MDYAVQDSVLKKKKDKLLQINRCRLYLKLLWPHDLLIHSTSDKMDPLLIQCQRPKLNQDLKFPVQMKPDKYAIQTWKEFIYRTFCKIRQHPPSKTLEFYLARYSINTGQREIKKDDDSEELLRSIMHSGSQLLDKFECLPDRFKNIIGNITLPEDEGEAILQAIKEGNALLASDGSFLQEQYLGTHAYKLISMSNPEMAIVGSAKSPKSNKMSSAPTEHYGAIAVLIVLIVLTRHHGQDSATWPDAILLIDNKEVVNRGNTLSPTFLNARTFLMHDYDLWMVLADLQLHLKLGINFEWIKSHQTKSNNTPPTKEEQALLEQKVQINTDVDNMASHAYRNEQSYTERGAFLSGEVCYHQDGAHVQDITKAISSIDSDFTIIQYYLSKGWKMKNLQQVDWIGMEKFMKKQSPISRCNIVQMIHDWQNTGSQKEKFFYSDSLKQRITQSVIDKGERLSKCPMGCKKTEVPFHFMKCMSDVMVDTRTKGLTDLGKGLSKLKTAPSLSEAIIHGIQCWTDEVEYDLDEKSHELLFSESHSKLLIVQSDIGWEYFVKGFIAKDWGHIQSSFYKTIRVNSLKFNRTRWVVLSAGPSLLSAVCCLLSKNCCQINIRIEPLTNLFWRDDYYCTATIYFLTPSCQ